MVVASSEPGSFSVTTVDFSLFFRLIQTSETFRHLVFSEFIFNRMRPKKKKKKKKNYSDIAFYLFSTSSLFGMPFPSNLRSVSLFLQLRHCTSSRITSDPPALQLLSALRVLAYMCACKCTYWQERKRTCMIFDVRVCGIFCFSFFGQAILKLSNFLPVSRAGKKAEKERTNVFSVMKSPKAFPPAWVSKKVHLEDLDGGTCERSDVPCATEAFFQFKATWLKNAAKHF